MKEESFSHSNEHYQRQQEPGPFKVTLTKPSSLKSKISDSSISKARKKRRKGLDPREDTHQSSVSPKSLSIKHEEGD